MTDEQKKWARLGAEEALKKAKEWNWFNEGNIDGCVEMTLLKMEQENED